MLVPGATRLSPAGVCVVARRSICEIGFAGRLEKAIVGLRPSFSAHVRPTASLGGLGDHGAPVRFPLDFATAQTPQGQPSLRDWVVLSNLTQD
jgi:hypothetical protein